MLWIFITMLASLSQTLRSVSQKNIMTSWSHKFSVFEVYFCATFSFLLLIFFIPYNDPIFLE